MAARRLLVAISFAIASLAPVTAQTPAPLQPGPPTTLAGLLRPQFTQTSGTLFENVVAMLRERFVDEEFRKKQLPELAEKFRARAAAAATLAEQRQVVHELLSHIPSSHLGLLSTYAHRAMMSDLLQVVYPSFGFQAIGAGRELYAGMLLEGGPAARAGLLVGDRLVTIDGVRARQSLRLDWRTDDAFIGDERSRGERPHIPLGDQHDRLPAFLVRPYCGGAAVDQALTGEPPQRR